MDSNTFANSSWGCASNTKTASSSPRARASSATASAPRASPMASRFFACSAALTIHPAATAGATVRIGPTTCSCAVLRSIANSTMPSMSERWDKTAPISAWSSTPHVSTSDAKSTVVPRSTSPASDQSGMVCTTRAASGGVSAFSRFDLWRFSSTDMVTSENEKRTDSAYASYAPSATVKPAPSLSRRLSSAFSSTSSFSLCFSSEASDRDSSFCRSSRIWRSFCPATLFSVFCRSWCFFSVAATAASAFFKSRRAFRASSRISAIASSLTFAFASCSSRSSIRAWRSSDRPSRYSSWFSM